MSTHEPSPQCKQILGSISDYVDGELQAELCAVLEEHLEGCEDCRIVVNTLRKTLELYKKAAPQADLPGEVRERLFLKLQLEDYLKKD